MERQELVTVYTVNNPAIAEMFCNDLRAEGIHCMVANEGQAGLVGLTGMEIQLQVPAWDADKARKLLKEWEHKHGQQPKDYDQP